jgi:hypothetical protein
LSAKTQYKNTDTTWRREAAKDRRKLKGTKTAIFLAADGVIRTAMIRRIHRHVICPGQTLLRPARLLRTP